MAFFPYLDKMDKQAHWKAKGIQMGTPSSPTEEISLLKNQILDRWGKKKPLCALFSTSNCLYLYDTGTNRILSCQKYEYELLNSLLTAPSVDVGLNQFLRSHKRDETLASIASIIESIKVHNILKLTEVKDICLSHEPSAVIDKANNELEILLLEVTQACNLRCRYCIYNEGFAQKRNHASVDMSHDVALKAIDHLRNCSKRREEVSISFYGGEPLLRFDTIRAAVAYTRKTLNNKKVSFSLTTNGTLINEDVGKFLASENFGVYVSIDGPKEVHDSWRKDKHGRGSFERAFAGLNLLAKKYGSKTNKIGLSIVYAPPYSEEKVESILKFIRSVDWLSDELQVSITYPHDESVPRSCHFDGPARQQGLYDFSLANWVRKRFFKNYRMKHPHDPISGSVLQTKLARLVQRPVLKSPINASHLNGCCLPGSRKIYVTATGGMNLCERIGLAPSIGSVYRGIDAETLINKYIVEYSRESLRDCAHCWLVHLCPLCYQQGFFDYEFDLNRKRQSCEISRVGAIRDLSDYCSLREMDEHGLDYLQSWKIS